MSEELLAKELAKLMEEMGTSNPVQALKKARKILKGRKTEHSRIVGQLYGILDATRTIREIEEEAFMRGYELGKKSMEEEEPREIKEIKTKMKLKSYQKMDRILDKVDKLLDLLLASTGNYMFQATKEEIKRKRSVKPKFKVEFEEKE